MNVDLVGMIKIDSETYELKGARVEETPGMGENTAVIHGALKALVKERNVALLTEIIKWRGFTAKRERS